MEKTKGFMRILLATDGSEQAKAAEDVAIAFAHASSGAVRVVHVWNLEVHHRHGYWDVEVRTEAEGLVNSAVERMKAAGIEADREICRADSDHVAAAVAGAARDYQADLVIAGSRGLSDWQSIRRHSVSHQLLCVIDCPVLIVRGRSSAAGHDAQRILLAIAGGDDLVPGVRAAVAAAAAPGSEVMVVHVAQAIVGVQGFAYIESDGEIRETIRQALDRLKDAGIEADGMVGQPGPVAQVVADVAAMWKADVIVIGSSRMGDIGSMLLGSVTHQLLRSTERPVLVAERVKA